MEYDIFDIWHVFYPTSNTLLYYLWALISLQPASSFSSSFFFFFFPKLRTLPYWSFWLFLQRWWITVYYSHRYNVIPSTWNHSPCTQDQIKLLPVLEVLWSAAPQSTLLAQDITLCSEWAMSEQYQHFSLYRIRSVTHYWNKSSVSPWGFLQRPEAVYQQSPLPCNYGISSDHQVLTHLWPR